MLRQQHSQGKSQDSDSRNPRLPQLDIHMQQQPQPQPHQVQMHSTQNRQFQQQQHQQQLLQSPMEISFTKGHVKQESMSSLSSFTGYHYQQSPQQNLNDQNTQYNPYAIDSNGLNPPPPLFTYPGMPTQTSGNKPGPMSMSPMYGYSHPSSTSAQQVSPVSNKLLGDRVVTSLVNNDKLKKRQTFSPFHSASASVISSNSSLISTTPSLDSFATSITSEMNDTINRKRRKPDLAVPGDICDSQLVELANNTLGSSIEEIAMQVKIAEKSLADSISSNIRNGKDSRLAEAQKKRQNQIFAMAVLMRSVETKETAVCPRNRIFNKYVAVCLENNISHVCNASFGKLVKVLYPSIKTRRLGIRGSSRYHYCGIKLIGDADDIEATTSYSPSLTVETPLATYSQSGVDTQQTHYSPSKDLTFDESLFSHFNDMTLDFVAPSLASYYNTQQTAQLKEIESFYTDYCCKLFRCIRYMKIKSLFEEMNSFDMNKLSTEANELTNKVQVQNWFIKCDQEFYLTSIKLLSKIIFQYVPEHVLTQVSNIESKYLAVLNEMDSRNQLSNFKMEASKCFVDVVSRLSRVITTAASASQSLAKLEVRNQMMLDWKRVDFDRLVERELRCSSIRKNEVLQLLENDIPHLFEKIESLDVDMTSNEDSGRLKSQVYDLIIQTFSKALAKIPSGFADSDPKIFLLSSHSLIDAILRQFTMDGITNNFGPWWSLACWINEFFEFLAELGRFVRNFSSSGSNLIVSDHSRSSSESIQFSPNLN
ncbi:hypothetical protein CANARDRAFT_173945 [[Candida] arabinofermentans NRRL YB-2248]|uniref:RFX-type winged-helix domain-containing protein n=1 Tax=[Candida] arabinofermentans NRRL YB-2248 TaxID=983967 RepID=A0A1E4T8K0_9ASCO|nr:hypothetical protein CANARDRAFT_173945 [[Candida] arabinofermentans NRRL YB-2248]